MLYRHINFVKLCVVVILSGPIKDLSNIRKTWQFDCDSSNDACYPKFIEGLLRNSTR